MPEGFEMEGGQRLSGDQQEALAKKLTEQIMGTPTGAAPFTEEQLEFLSMAFRELLVMLGREGLVLLGYNPVSVAYNMWRNGERMK